MKVYVHIICTTSTCLHIKIAYSISTRRIVAHARILCANIQKRNMPRKIQINVLSFFVDTSFIINTLPQCIAYTFHTSGITKPNKKCCPQQSSAVPLYSDHKRRQWRYIHRGMSILSLQFLHTYLTYSIYIIRMYSPVCAV